MNVKTLHLLLASLKPAQQDCKAERNGCPVKHLNSFPSPYICSDPRRNPNAVLSLKGRRNFRVKAAKLHAGVEVPMVQPKLTEPFLGFTKTANIWNSRACMMGLIGTFLVELLSSSYCLPSVKFYCFCGLIYIETVLVGQAPLFRSNGQVEVVADVAGSFTVWLKRYP